MIMTLTDVQYLADGEGKLKAVVVPIETWREIESELDTQYLMRSDTTRRRIAEALQRERGLPFDEALPKLGIGEDEAK